jgi:hypothetical protein
MEKRCRKHLEIMIIILITNLKNNTMKRLIIALLFVIPGISLNAQYLGYEGFTIQANKILFIEDEEPKIVDTDQVFVISFSDKVFVHLIFSDGSIDDSQIYKIESNTSFVDDEKTIYKFEALSGLSGNTFYYEIKINGDGTLESLKLTQPNQVDFIIYKGGISELKTFNQYN